MVKFVSIPFAAALLLTMATQTADAQDESANPNPSNANSANPELQPAQWSIVIHGGAGGDAAKFSEAKRKARIEGMTSALDEGVRRLSAGGEAIDVVEAVIRMLEDDAVFNAGRGAVQTTEGTFELDASIMNGVDHRCGAVATVGNCAHPITLARRVMTHTPHVLLAGKGAEMFADDQNLGGIDNSFFKVSQFTAEPEDTENLLKLRDDSDDQPPHFGTVGCVVRDARGNLAAGTSTGGTSKKLPGRLGDSPIIGAGTYADNATCAASGTGIGEEYIRVAAAYDLSAQIKYAGRNLADAMRMLIDQTLPDSSGGMIAIDRDGHVVIGHNTPSISAAYATSGGDRKIGFEFRD